MNMKSIEFCNWLKKTTKPSVIPSQTQWDEISRKLLDVYKDKHVDQHVGFVDDVTTPSITRRVLTAATDLISETPDEDPPTFI